MTSILKPEYSRLYKIKPDLTSTYKAVFLIANLILLLTLLKYTALLTTPKSESKSKFTLVISASYFSVHLPIDLGFTFT